LAAHSASRLAYSHHRCLIRAPQRRYARRPIAPPIDDASVTRFRSSKLRLEIHLRTSERLRRSLHRTSSPAGRSPDRGCRD
jgi:hypothetical protein